MEDSELDDATVLEGARVGSALLEGSRLGSAVLEKLRVSKGWKEREEVDDSNSEVSGASDVVGSAVVNVVSDVARLDREME